MIAALRRLAGEVARLTGELGRTVDVEKLGVLDRRDHLALAKPGLWSPNGACRLIQAADGWIAVNLARSEDADLVPAWLMARVGGEPWSAIRRVARGRPWRELVGAGRELGLPVAGVGEVIGGGIKPPIHSLGTRDPTLGQRRLRVLDLSALWAGPLCGAVFAEMGAQVVRVNSLRRPDPSEESTPEFFRKLNSLKSRLDLDLGHPADQALLRAEVLNADVLITAARPHALARLGLDPATVFADQPYLTWVAVTGYGWDGEAGGQVAFGDDAAAAGGLVRWTDGGAPRFLGDALADPITGLAAAVGALRAVQAGGGVMVDAALASCAAGAARGQAAGRAG